MITFIHDHNRHHIHTCRIMPASKQINFYHIISELIILNSHYRTQNVDYVY